MNFELLQALPALVTAAAEGGHESDGSVVSQFIAMLPDIITVILCFFLVYWILKKYAYGPILSAIDERRDRIESDLKRAEELRLAAEQGWSEIEQRLQTVEEEARRKMQDLLNDGKQSADEIREKGRQDSEALLDKARENIQYETQKAREELKQDIVNLTLHATEQIIRERLDDQKHRDLIGDFLNRLERN
ncbi:MAG: F0F1 ATP synthase subunit B [bacterium]|nr:F0F1 ATP synthase subunit B [bacterium]